MDTFNLENEIQDTVDEFVSNGKTFTAYDITQHIRNENSGEDVPHQTVKPQVHQAYRNGFMPGYDRERAVDIQHRPWRYLPPQDDAGRDNNQDDDTDAS